MDGSAAKQELVFVPAPGMGHIVSTVEIAKKILGRDHRLSITVLIMRYPFETKDSTYTQSLLSAADPRLKVVELPQDRESAAELLSMPPNAFLPAFVESNKPRVKNAVSEIVASESTRLAGFVVDMFCTPMIDVANEFGLPTYVFLTCNASFLGLVFHLYNLHHDHNQDITELKDDPEAEFSSPAFANPVPCKVLPSVVLNKEGGSTLFLNIVKRFKETKGIMVNTFTELESYAVKTLSDDGKIPPIYPVGPVLGEGDNKQSDEIMRWLDDQPRSSVVFLCFGSMGSFDGDQVKEIARALERAGHRFLWALRRPPPKGKVELPEEYENYDEVLPEGFLERTKKIGKVIGWAPQVAVLSHQAVGGFVSHCGWNSTLEGLWWGVPVATWPLYAEQQMNAYMLVRELGVAVEVTLDYEREIMMSEDSHVKIVTAEEIESGIRKLMDDGVGVEIRERVKEMSDKSRAAVKEGGSSYKSLGCFIEDVIKNTP